MTNVVIKDEPSDFDYPHSTALNGILEREIKDEGEVVIKREEVVGCGYESEDLSTSLELTKDGPYPSPLDASGIIETEQYNEATDKALPYADNVLKLELPMKYKMMFDGAKAFPEMATEILSVIEELLHFHNCVCLLRRDMNLMRCEHCGRGFSRPYDLKRHTTNNKRPRCIIFKLENRFTEVRVTPGTTTRSKAASTADVPVIKEEKLDDETPVNTPPDTNMCFRVITHPVTGEMSITKLHQQQAIKNKKQRIPTERELIKENSNQKIPTERELIKENSKGTQWGGSVKHMAHRVTKVIEHNQFNPKRIHPYHIFKPQSETIYHSSIPFSLNALQSQLSRAQNVFDQMICDCNMLGNLLNLPLKNNKPYKQKNITWKQNKDTLSGDITDTDKPDMDTANDPIKSIENARLHLINTVGSKDKIQLSDKKNKIFAYTDTKFAPKERAHKKIKISVKPLDAESYAAPPISNADGVGSRRTKIHGQTAPRQQPISHNAIRYDILNKKTSAWQGNIEFSKQKINKPLRDKSIDTFEFNDEKTLEYEEVGYKRKVMLLNPKDPSKNKETYDVVYKNDFGVISKHGPVKNTPNAPVVFGSPQKNIQIPLSPITGKKIEFTTKHRAVARKQIMKITSRGLSNTQFTFRSGKSTPESTKLTSETAKSISEAVNSTLESVKSTPEKKNSASEDMHEMIQSPSKAIRLAPDPVRSLSESAQSTSEAKSGTSVSLSSTAEVLDLDSCSESESGSSHSSEESEEETGKQNCLSATESTKHVPHQARSGEGQSCTSHDTVFDKEQTPEGSGQTPAESQTPAGSQTGYHPNRVMISRLYPNNTNNGINMQKTKATVVNLKPIAVSNFAFDDSSRLYEMCDFAHSNVCCSGKMTQFVNDNIWSHDFGPCFGICSTHMSRAISQIRGNLSVNKVHLRPQNKLIQFALKHLNNYKRIHEVKATQTTEDTHLLRQVSEAHHFERDVIRSNLVEENTQASEAITRLRDTINTYSCRITDLNQQLETEKEVRKFLKDEVMAITNEKQTVSHNSIEQENKLVKENKALKTEIARLTAALNQRDHVVAQTAESTFNQQVQSLKEERESLSQKLASRDKKIKSLNASIQSISEALRHQTKTVTSLSRKHVSDLTFKEENNHKIYVGFESLVIITCKMLATHQRETGTKVDDPATMRKICEMVAGKENLFELYMKLFRGQNSGKEENDEPGGDPDQGLEKRVTFVINLMSYFYNGGEGEPSSSSLSSLL